MDDLISRKEAENTIRKLLMETAINCADAGDPLDEFYVDIAHNRLETWISLIPAAPVSVPLDKLCEWLGERYEPPYSLIEIENLKWPIDFRKQKEMWMVALTKWMEGLDDHR